MIHFSYLLVLFALLNVWPVYGQTFNRRHDLYGLGRAQTAWGVEKGVSDGHVLFQASSDHDTIALDHIVNIQTLGMTWVNDQGEKIHERRLKTPGYGIYAGWANCCDRVSDGFVVGAGRVSYQGVKDVLLIRINEIGDTLWTRSFGAQGEEWIGRQVKHTSDGGFIIVGETDATGYIDGFAIKTDAMGNEEWRRTYGGPSTDGLASVDELSEGGYLFGGTWSAGASNFNMWRLRVNALGEEVWSFHWGSNYHDTNAHGHRLSDDNWLAVGTWSAAADYEPSKAYICKIAVDDGAILWESQYGLSNGSNQILFAGKEAPTGDLIACGVSNAEGPQKGLLLRTTSDGDSLWMFNYFYQDSIISNGTGRFFDVLPTEDGGFIAAGAAYGLADAPPPPDYSQDAWVVKVDAYGCIVPGCNPVGITEQATNLLDALRIWPNPARPGEAVNISLDLPQHLNDRQLDLTIVAMDGKVVHRQRVAGCSHSCTLALSHLTPGLYHLHITSGTTWYTGGKLVVE